MSVRSSDGKNFRRVARTAGDRVPAVGIRRNKAFYTATGGELSLDLQTLTPQISYQPGQAQLEVKSSAGPMIEGLDYYETSATTITFPSPGLSFGEVLEITQAFQYSGNLVAQVRPDEYSEVAAPGQTSVATDFSWPLNQNPAKRHGAIMVYLNGILQQRGASQDYVEVSLGQANTNQIQFNSAMIGGENISIVRAHQAIDETAASTQFNNTRLAELQEHFTKGFQAMVDESVTIAVPYTSVVGRARIPDIVNDLKPSFGVDRIPIEDIYLIQNEFGPNGERVWGVVGDDRGLIRIVGAADINTNPRNSFPLRVQNTGNDFIEVTFYGTGLNILITQPGATQQAVYSVDGGAESANFITTTSSVLTVPARGYRNNFVQNVVSGLSLGIHTVKIRVPNTSVAFLHLHGFEILNTASTSSLKINPGYAFQNGRKISSLAGSSSLLAKPATVTGGNGGRVVTYIKPDGSFDQSVQLVAASPSYLTAADHTNEELTRTYHFREFGAGGSTDFDVLPQGTVSSRSFVLEDGTTALLGQNSQTGGTPIENLSPQATGDYITFVFVGTGLDITTALAAAYTSTNQVTVDGVSVGSISSLSIGVQVKKIASGLKYGTHVVAIQRTSGGFSFAIADFKVYGPKKPSIPAGSIELSDYNVMADYTGNATAGATPIASGVLRKFNTREFSYIGSGWTISASPIADGSLGFQVSSTTNSDAIHYAFFGTGLEWRFSNNAASAVWQMSIDGSTNLSVSNSSPTPGTAGWSGAVSTNGDRYGAGVTSWIASTGTLTSSVTATTGNGVRVYGLTPGLHIITITKISGAGQVIHNALDIITPIHSPRSGPAAGVQNSLPIGSCSLSDSRFVSLVKSDKNAKNWAQAVGTITSPTTTSSVYVPMPDLSVTINTGANGKASFLRINYSIDFFADAAGRNPAFRVYVDGVPVGQLRDWITFSGVSSYCVSDIIRVPVSPGAHKVDVYWVINAGTLTANDNRRTLLVEEVE